MTVPGSNNDDLDPIAFWVLLLLSGGQRFSINDLVMSMNKSEQSVSKENILIALNLLKQRKFAKVENSLFTIDYEGVLYLTHRGILASEEDEAPKPKDFKNKLKLPFFSSPYDMLTWLAAPAIFFILTINLTSSITLGYTHISMVRRVYQVSTMLFFLGFFILYIRLSYHYVLESERLVVFRGGKAIGKKGPGLVFTLPLIDHIKIVDMREKSLEIKKEPCLTRDKMLMNTGFYMTWQVEDPIASLTKVSKIEDSMSLLCASALRTSIAQFNMEEALARQPALNTQIRTRIEHKAGDWGVQVNSTEIRELTPPENYLKQIENRFKVTLESEAALAMSNAKVKSLQQFLRIGEGMARNPIAFNLKYLDTLEKIGEGASTKYIIPMEFFNFLKDLVQAQAIRNDGDATGNGNNPAGGLPPAGLIKE